MKKNQTDYELYLKEHIGNVKKAYRILVKNDLVEKSFINKVQKLIDKHDDSKFTKEEYSQYDKYFYGKEKTDKIKSDFDYAWLSHQKKNPHHYQYWILNKDDGEVKALDMPYEYIIEMICDWLSFSIKSKDFSELGKFYKTLKGSPNISKNTKKTIEELVDKIKVLNYEEEVEQLKENSSMLELI